MSTSKDGSLGDRDARPAERPDGDGSYTSNLGSLAEEALARGLRLAPTGRVATYIPELGRADPGTVALALCTVEGDFAAAGAVEERFTLQSVSKVFALACLLSPGNEEVFTAIGTEPSGDTFHSIVRLEEERGRPRNPLINAGAIAVSDRLEGGDPQERIAGLRRFLRLATGEQKAEFAMDEAVYLSEGATGFRNRGLAHYMTHFGVVRDPVAAVDTYFRQCALTANVGELARAGLFLANSGKDPLSGERLVQASDCRTLLALMATCGLYDEVGRFAVRVGIPAKSGVSGAILGVVPGRMSIAAYGPGLGSNGNSVAAMEMLEFLSEKLHLSLFEARTLPV